MYLDIIKDCPYCGFELNIYSWECPVCRTSLADKFNFCPGCGDRVTHTLKCPICHRVILEDIEYGEEA